MGVLTNQHADAANVIWWLTTSCVHRRWRKGLATFRLWCSFGLLRRREAILQVKVLSQAFVEWHDTWWYQGHHEIYTLNNERGLERSIDEVVAPLTQGCAWRCDRIQKMGRILGWV
jgi:hypothetical protein